MASPEWYAAQVDTALDELMREVERKEQQQEQPKGEHDDIRDREGTGDQG